MEEPEASLFTQILLATQAIAYMSNRITGVQEQMKVCLELCNPVEHHTQIQVMSESIKEKNKFLYSVLQKLNGIAEDLGNDMNNSCITEETDEKITGAIFPVIGIVADSDLERFNFS